ncbi:MAG: PVC-type heme-binding CxxCH protein, partial [Planctomycetia bacterium]
MIYRQVFCNKWTLGLLLCAAALVSLLSAPWRLDAADPSDFKPEEISRIPGKSPAEAVKAFEVQAGFTMDPVAVEPLTTDPVDAAIDENGRLFIVEMRGYPFPEKMGDAPIGRVRVLTDGDGDGVFDKAETLVDELSWPTGVALWKGGCFVACAPDVLYCKDTNGDGKADVRKTVFTGFDRSNVQGLVNNLKWGLDGKIYIASGSNGGEIKTVDDPKAPLVSARGRDLRFDPATGVLEALAGSAQFGMCFDDWGNRFLCSNSNHAIEVVARSEYLARNPFLPAPSLLQSIAKEGGAAVVHRISQAEPWRVVRTRRRAASGVAFAATELVPAGYFTSATGVTVYRGSAYPEAYRGNLFVGDVGSNLIHRKTLKPNGVPLVAERADENTEFVRSTD